MRIVSLVPSITELLYSLGLDDEVVAITKFCVRPQKWFREKTRIGGTKNINTKKIKLLQPTLVIANKEENVEEQVKEIETFCRVYISNITDFDDALLMIQTVGILTNTPSAAQQIIFQIQNNFASLSIHNFKKAAYFIWKNPWMVAGGDTFISSMMQRAGFKNIFADKNRYPEITLDDLRQLNPEYILLSSEPYPFKQKDIEYLQQVFPHTKILLVDGEMFSWYGSRMMYAAAYFKKLF